MTDFCDAHPTADSLDDTGCRRLAAAIILQTASDLYDDIDFKIKHPDFRGNPSGISVCNIEYITKFVHSKWFNCLTDIDPDEFLDMVVDWYTQKRNLPRYIALWRNKLNKNGPELKHRPEKCYYEPSYLINVLNDAAYRSNYIWGKHEGRLMKIEY